MGFIDTVVSIFSSGKSRQKSKVIREAAEILEPHGLTPTALVGSGAFSEVFRVTGEDGKEFAAKLYTTKFTDLTSKQIAAVAVREISMATLLCNDNVVRFVMLIVLGTYKCLSMSTENASRMNEHFLRSHALSFPRPSGGTRS